METHVLAAVDATGLRASIGGRTLMAQLSGSVEMFIPRGLDRACMFFDAAEAGSCAIHRAAGEAALPSACRQFPREMLIDARGTLVSLSHFCPTAAAMLTVPGALDIVPAQPPLELRGEIDGLDATGALPPLVRPDLLADVDGYAAWESAALTVLARGDVSAGEALDRIEAATEDVRAWAPGPATLRSVVADAFEKRRASFTTRRMADAFAALIAQHIPDEMLPVADYESRWSALVEGGPAVELVMRNYLAARLFANWIAYQGRGLRTIVEWLRACHAVIRNEIALRCMSDARPATVADAVAAAQRADLLMVHTIDSQAFANFFLEAESEG